MLIEWHAKPNEGLQNSLSFSVLNERIADVDVGALYWQVRRFLSSGVHRFRHNLRIIRTRT